MVVGLAAPRYALTRPGTMRSVATVHLNMLPTADLGELRDPVLAVSAV